MPRSKPDNAAAVCARKACVFFVTNITAQDGQQKTVMGGGCQYPEIVHYGRG